MIRSLSKVWQSNGFFQFNRFKCKKSAGKKSSPPKKGSGSTSGVSASVLKTLDVEYEKLKKSKSKSLLKKYLTPEVFKKLRTKRTKSSTLLDCIQSGLKNHDSGCGVYAADAEAYKVFADLFDPIISDYHFGFKKTDRHPAKDFGNPCKFGDLDPHINYIASTRIRCARSVKGYPFNPCMTKQNYDDLEDLVHCTLTGLDDEFKGTYYPLLGMKKSIQQKLIDDHFLFKEGDRFLQAANASRFWPTGRGIYHNYEKTFVVWCNEEDHIRIISMQRGGNFREVFTRLLRGVNAVGKKIEFSHDERLGFLTFCPTNLGTTIRASVHIRVPKLASNPKKFQAIATKYKLQVRGTRGEHSDAEGGIYDVSNKRRMGLTEYQAVREIYKGITELIQLEKAEKGPAKSAKKSTCSKTPKKPPKTDPTKYSKTCSAKTCSKSAKKPASKPPAKKASCKKVAKKAAPAKKSAPKAAAKKPDCKKAAKKQPPPKAAQKKPPPKATKKTPKKPDPKGKKPGKK